MTIATCKMAHLNGPLGPGETLFRQVFVPTKGMKAESKIYESPAGRTHDVNKGIIWLIFRMQKSIFII